MTLKNIYVSGLQVVTYLMFCVSQALNSAGAGPFSTIATFVTPPSSPGPVVSVRASSTATSIHLVWKEPLSNGSPILSYNVNVGDRLAVPVGNVLDYVIDELTPETMYKSVQY
jgi:hypothetical protein